MNDAESTIAGLKAQACPGGGWNGMPAELEGKATVADCLAHGVCGCIYGDAVQHIEQQRARIEQLEAAALDVLAHRVGTLPTKGWMADTDQSRAALGRLADIISSLTPPETKP